VIISITFEGLPGETAAVTKFAVLIRPDQISGGQAAEVTVLRRDGCGLEACSRYARRNIHSLFWLRV
jgi:hypothetical protein